MSGRLTHAAVVLVTAASLIVSPVYAQSQQAPAQTAPSATAQARSLQMSAGPDYSKGPHWFPNIAAPYAPRHVDVPMLTNSPRVDQLVQDGKLMLSLDDAISLALENNLNIAVQRFTPWIVGASLLQAKSGVGGKTQFDPVVTSTLSLQQTAIPINNPFLSGVGALTRLSALENHVTVGNFGYSQGFETGTQLQVQFTNNRTSTSSAFNLFNPGFQTLLQVQLTQPLLNGFGKLPNLRYIIEAKNNVKVGESQFQQQVMATVAQVSTDYWELVYARENIHVQEAAVAVTQKLYEDNKKQLEIGTMAPLDVLTAQSQLATDQQNLIVARAVSQLDQTNLLNDIAKDPLAEPLAGVEIVPTTPISAPDITENIPIADAVREAWQKRPETRQAELKLENAGIEVKATRNALLPQLNLFGLYSAAGLGGKVREVTTTPTGAFTATTPVFSNPPFGTPGDAIPAGTTPSGFTGTPVTNATITFVPGGITDAWSNMIRSDFPTYQGGLTLTLPIRNRAAQAASATALLNQRQLATQYRQLQNTILVSIRNAQILLEQGRARVTAATEARRLAEQVLQDEQKKYQLGSSTSYNVVLRSRDLTSAQGTELRSRIDLIEAAVSFNQAVGRTLEVHHISVADAAAGASPRELNIPGAMDGDRREGQQ